MPEFYPKGVSEFFPNAPIVNKYELHMVTRTMFLKLKVSVVQFPLVPISMINGKNRS